MAFPVNAASGIDITHPSVAPAMGFTDEKGATQNVNPANAKLTLVHFWATWCVPCVAELPEIDATQKAYDKKIKVIAVSLDGDDAAAMKTVKAFMAEHNITHLPPYLDAHMDSYNASGIRGLPTTLFIDSKGNEIARAEGPVDWKSKDVTDFIDSEIK